ncbi:hypothetical protein QAD02_001991 [Eretmocerus hayati]|uniref:Uncharacterized protein n=1 Tax=Eretmocerus hayati TaxID=131215 RepID=A0ACC2NI01_9HYME|nr:hypothetical protein QAD02_001991 [Eretmocerus hayati]
MNRTTRFLAPASLAINACCPKVHLQTIPHRHVNITAKAAQSSTKTHLKACPKKSYMDNLNCKSGDERSDISSMNEEDISCAFRKMHVAPILDEKVESLDFNLNADTKTSRISGPVDKKKYKKIRIWKSVSQEEAIGNQEQPFEFRILSFNILAQDLLDTHSYLYAGHNKSQLSWEKRKPLIVQEILESEAHVICLQEVQENHLKDFLVPFQNHKFNYLYKRRTNDKTDGLLLMYREDIFTLMESLKVELFQNGIELLSRDNVGLIAKFSLKKNPETQFVVATTHLLYNPRRNDVRLGQVQLLFAEIERLSFIENTPLGPQYLPIILSGDFNLLPHSGVYKFITEGSIEFMGKGRNLEECDYRCLTNSLIPPHLYVTDECQHFNVLSRRLSGKGSGRVMLRNTECEDDSQTGERSQLQADAGLVDSKTTVYQKVEVADGHYVTFSSGLLTHPFQLRSVYNHQDKNGRIEATTFQDRWITVDYMFYSNMQVLEKYQLPSVEDCTKLISRIPNSVVGSDHFCIGATFRLDNR